MTVDEFRQALVGFSTRMAEVIDHDNPNATENRFARLGALRQSQELRHLIDNVPRWQAELQEGHGRIQETMAEVKGCLESVSIAITMNPTADNDALVALRQELLNGDNGCRSLRDEAQRLIDGGLDAAPRFHDVS